MTPEFPGSGLENYRDLVARVDDLCLGIEERFRPEIVCTSGCDGCCRHLSLFPVEAAALAAALLELSPSARRRIRARARSARPTDPCPLLFRKRCLLYAARPLICRTHGLPLLMYRDGARSVDYCPLNFKGLTSLPGAAVIDLDRLNEILVGVNLHFTRRMNNEVAWPDRLTVAEALLLDVSPF